MKFSNVAAVAAQQWKENMEQRKLIKRALLGDHEAAKRLIDAGVLVPCPKCGGQAEVYEYPGEDWQQPYTAKCKKNDCFWIGKDFPTRKQAIREWNTRAPILSSREMKMLHGKENP